MISRRHLIHLGTVSIVSGLAGCTSIPAFGTVGLRFRNYREESCSPQVQIEILGTTVLDQEFELRSGSPDNPYSRIEPDAVSNVPTGVDYTAKLFLNGDEVKSIEGTADCVGRQGDFDEEIDINIRYGRHEEILMDGSKC